MATSNYGAVGGAAFLVRQETYKPFDDAMKNKAHEKLVKQAKEAREKKANDDYIDKLTKSISVKSANMLPIYNADTQKEVADLVADYNKNVAANPNYSSDVKFQEKVGSVLSRINLRVQSTENLHKYENEQLDEKRAYELKPDVYSAAYGTDKAALEKALGGSDYIGTQTALRPYFNKEKAFKSISDAAYEHGTPVETPKDLGGYTAIDMHIEPNIDIAKQVAGQLLNEAQKSMSQAEYDVIKTNIDALIAGLTNKTKNSKIYQNNIPKAQKTNNKSNATNKRAGTHNVTLTTLPDGTDRYQINAASAKDKNSIGLAVPSNIKSTTGVIPAGTELEDVTINLEKGTKRVYVNAIMIDEDDSRKKVVIPMPSTKEAGELATAIQTASNGALDFYLSNGKWHIKKGMNAKGYNDQRKSQQVKTPTTNDWDSINNPPK